MVLWENTADSPPDNAGVLISSLMRAAVRAPLRLGIRVIHAGALSASRANRAYIQFYREVDDDTG